MARGNISIFIPHIGCPYICSFCDQRAISGSVKAPSPDEAEQIIFSAFEKMTAADRYNSEIAFFGGSFTAIPREYMISLLKRAEKYLTKTRPDGFKGVRLSTRPDCINDEILSILKEHGVTSIELGAQSMIDRVLELNRRGHTSSDVQSSAALIKSYGFETGLQMMTGLYGSSPEDDLLTMKKIADCSPDTVRIYPTVIMRGTYLSELYEKGDYIPYPFEECVRICAEMTKYFHAHNIKIIRMGLHAEESLDKNRIGGFWHPAFAELVRSELFRQAEEKIFSEEKNISAIYVSPADVSCAIGHKRSNINYFADKGTFFTVNREKDIPRDLISANGKLFSVYSDNSEGQ